MSVNSNEKFVEAIKFIYQNIDEPITLDEIAAACGVSVSSLKRLFIDATGSSLGALVRKLRMERAFRSLKNKEESVLEIALASGFEDASAFARSFKRNFGYSPSFAREKLRIVNELDSVHLEEPEIVEIESFSFQAVTKQGLYFEAAPSAWNELKSHLSHEILTDDFTGSFIAMGHDNPHEGEIAEDQVRFSAGVLYSNQNLNIDKISVERGCYGKFKFKGRLNNLGLAYHYIYGRWDAESVKKINQNKPAFMILDCFPEKLRDYSVEIYVPLFTEAF